MLCYSRGPGEVLSPEYLPWQSDTHRLISNTSSRAQPAARDIMHGGGGGAGPGFGGLGPNEPKDPWEVKKKDNICIRLCACIS